VTADGETTAWTGLSDLVVKGTRIYGGMWIFDEQARSDDGKFEVVPFAGKRDWISKALVHWRKSGLSPEGLARIGVTHSQGVSASRIELVLHRHEGGLPIIAQIDDEEFPFTPRVHIDVLPRALRLIVPGEYA